MGFFGSPNIDKMIAQKDFAGLVKQLANQKKPDVRIKIIQALGEYRNQPAADVLIDMLMDPNDDVSWAAVIALTAIGLPAVIPLCNFLRDPRGTSSHHQRAAIALGDLGDPSAGETLFAALGNDASLNQNVSFSLAKLGDQRAVPYLIPALEAQQAGTRKRAARTLGNLRASQAVGPLLAALNSPTNAGHAEVRCAIIAALGDIGDEGAASVLVEALDSSNESEVRAAIQALPRVGRAARTLLLETLKKPKSWTRSRAASALDALGKPIETDYYAWYLVAKQCWGDVARLGTQALEPLTMALHDPDKYVREGAAEMIVRMGLPHSPEAAAWIAVIQKDWQKARECGRSAVDPLLQIYSYSNSPEIVEIIELLGQIGGPECIDWLSSYVNLSEKPESAAAAMKTLAKIGTEPAARVICLYANRFNANLSAEAAAALGHIGHPSAVPLLLEYISHSDGMVRQSAAEALGKIVDSKSVPALLKTLCDPLEAIRDTAAKALIGYPVSQAEWALIEENLWQAKDPAIVRAMLNVGWRPKDQADLARYFVTTCEFDLIPQIGLPAIEPLIQSIVEYNDLTGRLWQQVDEIRRKSISDPEPGVPNDAVYTKEIVRREKASALSSKIDTIKNQRIRPALRALSRISEAGAAERLRSFRDHPNVDIRNAVSQALENCGIRAIDRNGNRE